jgi:serine/threonine protein kinase
MSLPPGTRLGPYEILAPIGAGGMGEVYRARDSKLDRDVAIKVLPESVAADPDTLARFEREAKAVAALSHPNILAIHDFGMHEGTAYAVMELLEGETLNAMLTAGPIPPKQAVDYALQVARGLSAAHEKGIVHRDLKPDNLFVNLTVTQPTALGHLVLFPGDLAQPPASTINYREGQTRANNAIELLGTAGTISVACGQATGTTHFILDVNGYFQ